MKKVAIDISNANIHYLNNIDLKVFFCEIVCIVGVSGSGKSTLVKYCINDLARSRHLALSEYSEYNMGASVDKNDVVSFVNYLEQGVLQGNFRSIVGTATSIIQKLRKMILPHLVVTDSCDEIIPAINTDIFVKWKDKFFSNESLDIIVNLEKMVLGPASRYLTTELLQHNISHFLVVDAQNGFNSIGKVYTIEQFRRLVCKSHKDIYVVFSNVKKENDIGAIFDLSIDLYPQKNCYIKLYNETNSIVFSLYDNLISLNDRFVYIKPVDQLLSFNSRGILSGQCEKCHGLGFVSEYLYDDLFLRSAKPIVDGGINLPFNDVKKDYLYLTGLCDEIRGVLFHFQCPLDSSWSNLSLKIQNILCQGDEKIIFQPIGLEKKAKGKKKIFIGIFQRIEDKIAGKSAAAERFKTFKRDIVCNECYGTKFNYAARSLKFQDLTIDNIFGLTIQHLRDWLRSLEGISSNEAELQALLLICDSCINLGLGHLQLNRSVDTLSGGEAQRLRIGRELWAVVSNCTYVLDEPSRGMHTYDVKNLFSVFKLLQTYGNSILLVEHNPYIIAQADRVIELGPEGGACGGDIIYDGPPKCKENPSDLPMLTSYNYSNHTEWLHIKNINENNIVAQKLTIPLRKMVCLTGVSGSGKSTLLTKVILPTLTKNYQKEAFHTENLSIQLSTEVESIEVVLFSQDVLNGNHRSKILTQLDIGDLFRDWFYKESNAEQYKLQPSSFSTNTIEGQCPICGGIGYINDSFSNFLTCSDCLGSGFNIAVTFVKIENMSIVEWMNLPFIDMQNKELLPGKIKEIVNIACDLGLGHLCLGRSIPTLSGGECQRLKVIKSLLAFNKKKDKRKLHLVLLMDEPVAGLHGKDIDKLLGLLKKHTIDQGHTLIAIEHNLQFISQSDWIVEMGPGGAELGGNILFSGILHDLMSEKNSFLPTHNSLKNNNVSIDSIAQRVDFKEAKVTIENKVKSFRHYLKKDGDFNIEDDAQISPAYLLNRLNFQSNRIANILGIDVLLYKIFALITNSKDSNAFLDLNVIKAKSYDLFQKNWRIGWIPCVNDSEVVSIDDIYVQIRQHVKDKQLWFDGRNIRKNFPSKDEKLDYRLIILLMDSQEDFETVFHEAICLGRGVIGLVSMNSTCNIYSTRMIDSNYIRYGARTRDYQIYSPISRKFCCKTCYGKGVIESVELDFIFDDLGCNVAEDRLWSKYALEVLKPFRRNILIPTIKRLKDAQIIDLDKKVSDMSKYEKDIFLYGFPYRSFLKKNGNVNHVSDYYKWSGISKIVLTNMWKASSRSWAEKLDRSKHEISCPECQGSGMGWEARSSISNGIKVEDIVLSYTVSDMSDWLVSLLDISIELKFLIEKLLLILSKLPSDLKIFEFMKNCDQDTQNFAIDMYIQNNKLSGADIDRLM